MYKQARPDTVHERQSGPYCATDHPRSQLKYNEQAQGVAADSSGGKRYQEGWLRGPGADRSRQSAFRKDGDDGKDRVGPYGGCRGDFQSVQDIAWFQAVGGVCGRRISAAR